MAALGLYLFNAPPSSFFELLEGLTFFFALGVISTLIGFAVALVLTGGQSTYTFDSAGDIVHALGWPALTAGVFTAAASFLVLEPRDDRKQQAALPNNGDEQP